MISLCIFFAATVAAKTLVPPQNPQEALQKRGEGEYAYKLRRSFVSVNVAPAGTTGAGDPACRKQVGGALRVGYLPVGGGFRPLPVDDQIAAVLARFTEAWKGPPQVEICQRPGTLLTATWNFAGLEPLTSLAWFNSAGLLGYDTVIANPVFTRDPTGLTTEQAVTTASQDAHFFASVFEGRAREPEDCLNGLHLAERSFFGEFGVHTTDLVAADWGFIGNLEPAYAYGFCVPGPRTVRGLSVVDTVIARDEPAFRRYDPTRDTSALPSLQKAGGYVDRSGLVDPCKELARLGLADRFRLEGDGYHAFAARRDADGTLDVWSIDETHKVEHVHGR